MESFFFFSLSSFAGMAEFASKERRPGLHRTGQRRPVVIARHARPHRAGVERSGVHLEPDAGRRRAEACRVRSAGRATRRRAARGGEAVRSSGDFGATARRQHREATAAEAVEHHLQGARILGSAREEVSGKRELGLLT